MLTNRKKRKSWRPLSEAMDWMVTNHIRGSVAWSDYRRLGVNVPIDIPSSLERGYGDQFYDAGGWHKVRDRIGSSPIRGISRIELSIKRVFSLVFFCEPLRRQIIQLSSGKRLWVDMVSESRRLVVEYDGVYFHREKVEKDRFKTLTLLQENPGWRVIRLREHGLDLLDCVWDLHIDPLATHLDRSKAFLRHLLKLDKSSSLLLQQVEKKTIRKLLLELNDQDFEDIRFQGWRSFDEIMAWARSEKIESGKDWFRRCRIPGYLPDDIPIRLQALYPDQFRKSGGWEGFLGTSWAPLAEAAAWARSEGVIDRRDFDRRCLIPGWRRSDIPAQPSQVYGDEFRALGGWRGFLQTQWWPYAEARAWATALGLPGKEAWEERCRNPEFRPANVPANPQKIYQEEFKANGGWKGFLGNDPGWWDLDTAAAWAQSQGFSGNDAWLRFKKTAAGSAIPIPANIPRQYGDEFYMRGGSAWFFRGVSPVRKSKVRPE